MKPGRLRGRLQMKPSWMPPFNWRRHERLKSDLKHARTDQGTYARKHASSGRRGGNRARAGGKFVAAIQQLARLNGSETAVATPAAGTPQARSMRPKLRCRGDQDQDKAWACRCLSPVMQPQPRKPARQAFTPSGSQSHERISAQAAHRAGLVYTHTHTQIHTHKYTQKQTHNHKQKYTHSHTHTQTHRHKQSPAQTRTDTHPTAGTTHGQEQKGASARTGPQETYLAAQESEAAPTTQPLRARMQLRTLVEARKQRCHKASGPGELPKDTKPSARCQVKHGPCSGESTWIPIDAAQCAHWAEKLAQTASSDAKKKFRKVYIYYKGQKYRANVGFLQTLSAKGIPHERDIYQRTKTPQRRGGAASGAGRSPPARAPSIEASPTRA